MTAEELRSLLASEIDGLLSYRVVRGLRRTVLSALRSYVGTMPASELDKLAALVDARRHAAAFDGLEDDAPGDDDAPPAPRRWEYADVVSVLGAVRDVTLGSTPDYPLPREAAYHDMLGRAAGHLAMSDLLDRAVARLNEGGNER